MAGAMTPLSRRGVAISAPGHRQAGPQQRRQRRGESCHDPLFKQRTEQRHRKEGLVPDIGPSLCAEEPLESQHSQHDHRNDNQQSPAQQDFAYVDKHLCYPGQLLAGLDDLLGDHRNDLDRQEYHGEQAEQQQYHRVDHRGDHL